MSLGEPSVDGGRQPSREAEGGQGGSQGGQSTEVQEQPVQRGGNEVHIQAARACQHVSRLSQWTYPLHGRVAS